MIAKDYNSITFLKEKKDELYFIDAYSFTYLLCVPIDPGILSDFAFLLKLWDISNVAELSRSFIK